MTQDEPGPAVTSRKNGEKSNRLSLEKSPYLLQHAGNPVDWYPWGDEAFERAKREDKPVFLSIGYSTCHWCHVMAHESFEDPEVAALMNDAFVSIKVDREERPDIDQIYMTACQMMTGRGGWPLTIIMTPDKRPFFAATYIPREGRMGMTGMKELVPEVKRLWLDERERVLSTAGTILDHLRSAGESGPAGLLDASTLARAYAGLSRTFDPENGGFGGAPKFPTPHNLMFLLRQWKRTGAANALDMVEATLQAMRMGGIYDHVGLGFHRYSTDARWTVPHFEKMLYDQALLAIAYVEAYQATGRDEYARTCREILAYVGRVMTSPDGGFYSAEDADSEGVEGKFYVWTEDELRSLLDKDEYALLSRVFEISPEGNFEGKIVLRMRSTLDDASSVLRIPGEELREGLEAVRTKLFDAREGRVHPARDDKILTDWNGLMIAAFAKAAWALGDRAYASAAKRAADFLLEKMRSPDGRLLHRYRDGAGILANADDYVFLIWGLIELYGTAFDEGCLKWALRLQDEMIDHFWDGEKGGFYFTPDYGEPLPVRQKEIYDGAVPSSNSVAAMNLMRLDGMTGSPHYGEMADAITRAFAEPVEKMPSAYCMLMSALDLAIGPTYEVAIAEGDGAGEMMDALRSRFLPRTAVILVTDEMRSLAGFATAMRPLGGRAAAYVCRGHACELPTTHIDEMMRTLGEGA